ncbi:tRNA synthetases class I-domain-containing protein [Sphaerosporella brunnea]|uniref:Tyrosine--tRNA ligase n=1 Tax=Sphaerosporella brunnea TaxID=1250544 RepID=A0A5J5EEN3_9PEZI|nr:tRNA synthetases class I-domain-containing protein [Sphaerosporella brunnea]
MAELSATEKIALIKQGLQEVLQEDIIVDVIEKQQRPLKIYWGTAPTGRPHCGYFVPMVKIAHFLQAGCEVKVLLADIHAFLDNMKAPLELVAHRAKYYELVIKSVLRAIGVSIEKLTFVKGSDYQLKQEYTMDLFRLSSIVTEHDAKKAGAEVVKQVASPLLSGLIYPLMQALDEEHLGVDAQFGGVDQRKIFTLAAENLTKIGFKERAHLMNPMVPGLAGGKMSASDPNSKIDLLDKPEVVKSKLRKAVCAPQDTEDNGVLSFVEYVLFPIAQLSGEPIFHVPRPDKYGGPVDYSSFEKLKEAYADGSLQPGDLKAGVEQALNALLAPIQAEYTADEEWQNIAELAYPPPVAEKKKKKEKKIGTGYHANKGAVVADGKAKPKEAVKEAVGTGAEEALEKLKVDN